MATGQEIQYVLEQIVIDLLDNNLAASRQEICDVLTDIAKAVGDLPATCKIDLPPYMAKPDPLRPTGVVGCRYGQ